MLIILKLKPKISHLNLYLGLDFMDIPSLIFGGETSCKTYGGQKESGGKFSKTVGTTDYVESPNNLNMTILGLG